MNLLHNKSTKIIPFRPDFVKRKMILSGGKPRFFIEKRTHIFCAKWIKGKAVFSNINKKAGDT